MTRIRIAGLSGPDCLLVLLVYAAGAGCALLANVLAASGSLSAISFGQDSRWNVVSEVLVPLTMGTLASYYASGDDVAEMRARVGSMTRLSAAARPTIVCSVAFALALPLVSRMDPAAALLASRNFALTYFCCATVKFIFSTRIYLVSGAILFFASTFSGSVSDQGLLGIFYWDPTNYRDASLSATFLVAGIVMFASSKTGRKL